MTTISVESISSLYLALKLFSFGSQGQLAFASSTRTSPMNAFVCEIILMLDQHARRDSNPQPTVLETATLPIELLA